jgi:hypothetical protein
MAMGMKVVDSCFQNLSWRGSPNMSDAFSVLLLRKVADKALTNFSPQMESLRKKVMKPFMIG